MMRRRQDIADAQYILWRGTSNGVHTMGPCCRDGCENSARGSGVCVACATVDLGKVVGEEIATDYLATIRLIRQLEGKMK